MVMGILNVTPDSFSDGGLHLSPNAAVSRAEEMLSEGAGIIDVGPESTRPGSLPVDADEQIRRAVPVIAEIHRRWPDAILSVDTRLAAVADAAIDAGAEMVNDTAALRDDPALGRVVAESGAAVVLMHRRGVPAGMQKDGGPTYADVIAEIMAFFRERIDSAIRCGIEPSRIALDPGIGFGKRVEHNLEIVRHLDQFTGLDRPVVLGASRKRFIGEITGVDDPRDRMAGSLVCAVFGAEHGAAIIRAHDVRETVQTLRMWRGIRCLSSR
jgi:dihydropteroate synthase